MAPQWCSNMVRGVHAFYCSSEFIPQDKHGMKPMRVIAL